MKLATCHPHKKEQARGLCKNCYDKWLKDNNPVYKQKQISNTTRWAKNNPDKMAIIQQRRKEKDSKNPNNKLKARNRFLKRKYGITHDDYLLMLIAQDGGCAICSRKPEINKHLHIDHCHNTNRVRGLLCHQCNWYLGTIDADPDIWIKIALYLSIEKK